MPPVQDGLNQILEMFAFMKWGGKISDFYFTPAVLSRHSNVSRGRESTSCGSASCVHLTPEINWFLQSRGKAGEVIQMYTCTNIYTESNVLMNCTRDNSCNKHFYDSNVCIHTAALQQLLTLTAAEHKNVLVVNLHKWIRLNLLLQQSTNTLNSISATLTLQLSFHCLLDAPFSRQPLQEPINHFKYTVFIWITGIYFWCLFQNNIYV